MSTVTQVDIAETGFTSALATPGLSPSHDTISGPKTMLEARQCQVQWTQDRACREWLRLGHVISSGANRVPLEWELWAQQALRIQVLRTHRDLGFSGKEALGVLWPKTGI